MENHPKILVVEKAKWTAPTIVTMSTESTSTGTNPSFSEAVPFEGYVGSKAS